MGLKRPNPRKSGQLCVPPIWSCSRWGLPSRLVAQTLVRSYRTVSPLPWLPLTWNAGRFDFCGTFLKVTFSGCYPAPCPVELGLSSDGEIAACDHSGYLRSIINMLTPHRIVVNSARPREDPCRCQDPCPLHFFLRIYRCRDSLHTLYTAWCQAELPDVLWVLTSRKSRICVSQHASPPMQNLENQHPLNYISTLHAKFLLSSICNLLHIRE